MMQAYNYSKITYFLFRIATINKHKYKNQMKKTLIILGFTTLVNLIGYAQQTCATAQVITAGTGTITAINGTQTTTLICAPGGTGATAANWYKYTPLQNYAVTVTTDFTANAGVDNRVHIYTGNCANLACLTGDDDSGTNTLCVASFNVTANTDYYIVFDNLYSSLGFQYELIENPIITPPQGVVTFSATNISSINGSYNLAIADINGDYLDDIVSVSSNSIKVHTQNTTGPFTINTYTTTTAQFMPSWSMAMGDINADGYNDLLYGSGSGVTFMVSQNGGTAYNQVSGSQYVFSQRSNFMDINNDGHLDAFVCHDVAPNVFYINDGSGNLTFNQGGMGNHPNGGNYGSIWVDYNNDNLPDLFIAKCRGGTGTAKINELHKNNGNGTFTDVSLQAGLADPIQTWSSAWNDFDNDGWMDVVVGASSNADGMHKFMHNSGDGTFSNVTTGSGLDVFSGLSIEYVSYDFNNDGFADVFTNGYLLINNKNNTFTPQPVPMQVGAVGDLNNDGFLDVQNGSTIYYNNGNSNNWITVTLKGTTSNINGIGARVEIYGNWGKQIRDVRSGIGFRYMGTLNAHFGIDTASTIDSVVVRWPSGNKDVICNPSKNSVLHIEENSAPIALAAFAPSATMINETDSVDFMDASAPCPSSWYWTVSPTTGWTFTNGTSAASQNPRIIFHTAGTYQVSLLAANSNGASTNTSTASILVQSVTGMADHTQQGISVFPNPINDKVYINPNQQKIKGVRIVSVLGSEVESLFNNSDNSINVSHLKSGVYFLYIITENNQTQVSRLVKK
jgi:PKD repeat protein